MVKYVVYSVEFLSDVDGRGPEELCSYVAEFDTEQEADTFVDTYHDYCKVVVE